MKSKGLKMFTAVEVSDDLYECLVIESNKRSLTVEELLHRWVKLGQLFEPLLSREDISLLLRGRRIQLTYGENE